MFSRTFLRGSRAVRSIGRGVARQSEQVVTGGLPTASTAVRVKSVIDNSLKSGVTLEQLGLPGGTPAARGRLTTVQINRQTNRLSRDLAKFQDSKALTLKQLRNMENVVDTQGTYGVYDIVARIESDSHSQLAHIISDQIRKINNISSTLTLFPTDKHEGELPDLTPDVIPEEKKPLEKPPP